MKRPQVTTILYQIQQSLTSKFLPAVQFPIFCASLNIFSFSETINHCSCVNSFPEAVFGHVIKQKGGGRGGGREVVTQPGNAQLCTNVTNNISTLYVQYEWCTQNHHCVECLLIHKYLLYHPVV
jgi:hypothetical protein